MSGEPVATGTEREVCRDIAARQRLGIAKYGRTVAENPLSMREWLQHAYEEVLDTAVYLKRLMEEMDGPGRVCGSCGGVVAGRHGTCRQCLEEDVAVVRRRPTGFVARCQCGKMTGALDYLRASRQEAGEILGLWLAEGRTVEPRFSGAWEVELETCVCVPGS